MTPDDVASCCDPMSCDIMTYHVTLHHERTGYATSYLDEYRPTVRVEDELASKATGLGCRLQVQVTLTYYVLVIKMVVPIYFKYLRVISTTDLIKISIFPCKLILNSNDFNSNSNSSHAQRILGCI